MDTSHPFHDSKANAVRPSPLDDVDQPVFHDKKSVVSSTHSVESCEIEPLDPEIVSWDGPDDPTNPMNFSHARKLSIVFTVSSLTFSVAVASSMFSPGVPSLMKEFNQTSSVLSSLIVSIYVLGFAVGPLFIAPLSEMYGRSILYRISTVIFAALTLACGECNSFAAIFVLRFLCGTFGSTSFALGSGSVADVTPVEKRGRYTSIYNIGPVLGPAVGPVAGAFLSAISWRWVFRVLGILAACLAIMCFFTLPETYGPYLLLRKARQLRRETGNDRLRTIYEDRMGTTPRARFVRNIIRPMKLLMFSPIVQILSLFVATTYGMFYLLFTTFTEVFEVQYGWASNIVGLSYIGLSLGSLLALTIIIIYSDKILLVLAERSKSKQCIPEHRLPILIFLAPTLPVGLVVYGWGVYCKAHWIVPLVGTFLIGVGVLSTFSPTINYLVDAHGIYAASAASASIAVRSLGGAFLPLSGPALYRSLGYGWGNTLLGLIVLIWLPVPILLYMKGAALRARFNPSL
ncbi:putative bicyclomycin resistance protein [Myxozyma melibiosi]|uniref:Bicyclomycin resistance protein n=1 Tax=Myxozyma melibiosi TaxID=54550 RepID=A0ABR1EY17_9ASCO